jgi:histidine ammonia-lyase
VRAEVATWREDRFFQPDLEAAIAMVIEGAVIEPAPYLPSALSA